MTQSPINNVSLLSSVTFSGLSCSYSSVSLRLFSKSEEWNWEGQETLRAAPGTPCNLHKIFDNWALKSKVTLSPDPGLTIFHEHGKRGQIWIRSSPRPSLGYFTMYSLENCHPGENICSFPDSDFHNISPINRLFCYLSLCSTLVPSS